MKSRENGNKAGANHPANDSKISVFSHNLGSTSLEYSRHKRPLHCSLPFLQTSANPIAETVYPTLAEGMTFPKPLAQRTQCYFSCAVLSMCAHGSPFIVSRACCPTKGVRLSVYSKTTITGYPSFFPFPHSRYQSTRETKFYTILPENSQSDTSISRSNSHGFLTFSRFHHSIFTLLTPFLTFLCLFRTFLAPSSRLPLMFTIAENENLQ